MNQTIASVAELAPGDTYSRELGGKRFTVHWIRKTETPDPFGREVYSVTNDPGAVPVLLLASDDVWRDN